MSIITQEHLFQWNITQVLNNIEQDYYKEINDAIDSNSDIHTFEDWLNYNPSILGQYMLEQLNSNFDFYEFKHRFED